MTSSQEKHIVELLDRHFPGFTAELKEEIASVSEVRHIPAGEMMMDTGNYIKSVPLLIDGMVKTYREDEAGNELFLYYIYPGEACAISFVCSMRERKSNIKALTESNCDFIVFPIKYMDEWMSKHKSWYYFVLETFNMRFEEVLKSIDEIAFHNMDERLANYLAKASGAAGSRTLALSHQEIAQELNSSREVISRLLKKMERVDMIKLGRGKIEIIDLTAKAI
ncbi:MAG: CRP/FNR family transcriptional regulator [Flavobacteriales bacterium]|jgi:CRP/FNR family transcriptional regulator